MRSSKPRGVLAGSQARAWPSCRFSLLVVAPDAAASIVLYNQYDNAGTIATGSQNYEASQNAYDARPPTTSWSRTAQAGS